MLQTHYRSPLDFSEERVAEASVALCRIGNAVKNLNWLLKNAEDGPSVLDAAALSVRTEQAKEAFIQAMDDDFNTCKALGEVFEQMCIRDRTRIPTCPGTSPSRRA